jgi:hypothetical protein
LRHLLEVRATARTDHRYYVSVVLQVALQAVVDSSEVAKVGADMLKPGLVCAVRDRPFVASDARKPQC